MSKDKKRQLIFHQVDDNEAISRHLEKMAGKGWLLEKVDNWFYTFRRSEPVDVRYAVTFFPEASYFDPRLTEGQETYAEYCEAAGWELAGAYGPVQYFRTTNPDPLPIETDETMKLAAIRKTMRKTFIFTYVSMLVIPAMGLPLCLSQYRNDPLAFFCTNHRLGNLLIQSGIVLFCFGMLLDYLIWLLRSSHAVARGGCCKKPHTKFRLGLTVFVLAVCVASIALFLSSDPWLRTVFSIYLVIYGGIMILSRLVLRKLKETGSDRSTVRGAYIAFAIIAGIVVGFGSTFLTAKLIDAGIIHTHREPAETYTYVSPDSTFRYPVSIYHDDLPITLEELGYTVTADNHCSYEENISRSLIASRRRYTQEALNFGSGLPDLFCQTYDTQWTWVLEKCWEFLISNESNRWYGPEILQKLDPTPWGASEAYCQEGVCTYLLRYPNRIVTFHLGDFETTPQQINQIVQALRP